MLIINHDINVVTDALIQKYGNVASHVASMGYMSSSCFITNYTMLPCIYYGSGHIDIGGDSGVCRAFMRL